jgi:hypothetical protein
VTLAAVGAVVAVVVWAMDPSLLLANTTTAGGDTGAHVALAQYMKTSLLPHLHVTGWDPGAYDGFPLNTFYFPLPDTLAALGGYIIPFNVAFKLMTILGSVTLPVAAWAFGRLAGLERPRPALLAVSTLPFLFDQSFTIYGGNLFSTLAGEYAYSLGISFALVFLGVAIRGMRSGNMRVVGALLLAACILCHVVTALFALLGAVLVLMLSGPTRRRAWWMISTIGTGVLLVAWWAVPFMTEQAYSTNMGWKNVTTFAALLAPGGDRWALAVGALGALIAVVRRDRWGILITLLAVAGAVAVVADPQGKLYNTRFLPIWWLCVYLMAGLAFAEIAVLLARLSRAIRVRLWEEAGIAAMAPAIATAMPLTALTYEYETGEKTPVFARRLRFSPWAPGAVAVPLIGLVASLAVVVPDLAVSSASPVTFGPLNIRHNDVTDWAKWNYSGYERKTGWPELENGIIATLDTIGRRYGCGRVMWEYNSNLNRFGTPESLMDIPMWTGGCMDSMEGLLFESASTTPFHFLNQSELSAGPSDAFVPQDGLSYGSLDVDLGIEHLQLLGVRYFMASSLSVQQAADADPALTQIASSGPWRDTSQGTATSTTWKFYLVHDSPLVSGLQRTPTVLDGIGPSQASWLPVAVRWYAKPAEWDQQLVAGGPSSWPRSTATAALVAATTGDRLPKVNVTNVRTTDDEISFSVDRVGVPLLVRTSFFPAWHATGASGPWRAEPNLMVVVPTSREVTLHYGSTGGARLGDVLSVVGLVCLVVLVRRRDRLTSAPS